ncbi:MAG: ABC transporter permease [Spirochaetota bacterium]
MLLLLDRLGQRLLVGLKGLLYGLGYFARLLVESFRFFGRGRVGRDVLVMQILFTGLEALPVVGILALAIGVAINLIGSSVLAGFGQGQVAYTLLIIVITKELGPLLTAFIVTARSGTAIAIELGGMSVSHELEAYVAVGADPIASLAAPRFIGVVMSLLLLDIYFNIFGLLGSFGVLQLLHPVALDEYFRKLLAVLKPADLVWGLVKSLIFGAIISVVATYRGFAVERASTEIPVAGIRAVGSSFILVIIADAIITAAAYSR